MTGAVSLVAALFAPAVHARVDDTLRVTVIVDDTAARRSLLRGVALGAAEASHTGALFCTAVDVRIVTSDRATAAATSPLGAGPSLLVVAGDSTACAVAVGVAQRVRAPVLDVGCPPAVAIAGGMYSLVAAPPTPADDSTRVELWSGSLDRFGGEQLNDRYHRRFGARMDSPAWAGWMAVKIALELSMRARGAGGPLLARQLADPRTQFDGQKGRPLRFDANTRQLVQPRYRVAGDGDAEHVVSEVAP
jgi:hypothetical protein